MSRSPENNESFTFTVGKLGILLGERAHLIEFPSILLPPGATAGSIVNIAVHQNHAEEKRRESEFWALQDSILNEFGIDTPQAPVLSPRNVTQTSITLEWPPLVMATAKLRSLDIYRNGQRLAAIPSPLTNTSTKLSGLEICTPYTFQLVLRTTAGVFPSNVLKVKTHSMEDTTGISVCFGKVEDELLRANAEMALKEMGARWSERIQIDTTHFVCTSPAAIPVPAVGNENGGGGGGAPGVEYQRALQLSIPVVTPHWILACHSEKRMVSIGAYYLGAQPTPTSASSAHAFRPQSMSSASLSLPRSPSSPGFPSPSSNADKDKDKQKQNRASMPVPARKASVTPPGTGAGAGRQSPFVGQNQSSPSPGPSPIPEAEEPTQGQGEDEDSKTPRPASYSPVNDDGVGDLGQGGGGGGGGGDGDGDGGRDGDGEGGRTSTTSKRKSRSGTMNREFRFPSPAPGSGSPTTSVPSNPSGSAPAQQARVITPSSIEVPPPPPVEKERSISRSTGMGVGGHEDGDGDDELGETVEVDLS